MNESPRAFRPKSLESIRCEVNSKCASLRAAARLMPNLSDQDSEKILALMTEAAFQLARALYNYRWGSER